MDTIETFINKICSTTVGPRSDHGPTKEKPRSDDANTRVQRETLATIITETLRPPSGHCQTTVRPRSDHGPTTVRPRSEHGKTSVQQKTQLKLIQKHAPATPRPRSDHGPTTAQPRPNHGNTTVDHCKTTVGREYLWECLKNIKNDCSATVRPRSDQSLTTIKHVLCCVVRLVSFFLFEKVSTNKLKRPLYCEVRRRLVRDTLPSQQLARDLPLNRRPIAPVGS